MSKYKITPTPGNTEVYGAIIRAKNTGKFCLVQGNYSGKWSLPKGHVNIDTKESPFECMSREVQEEIGITNLPYPLKGMPLRVGYYYIFEVPYELSLHPNDKTEIKDAKWFSLDEMQLLNTNIDATIFKRKKYNLVYT